MECMPLSGASSALARCKIVHALLRRSNGAQAPRMKGNAPTMKKGRLCGPPRVLSV